MGGALQPAQHRGDNGDRRLQGCFNPLRFGGRALSEPRVYAYPPTADPCGFNPLRIGARPSTRLERTGPPVVEILEFQSPSHRGAPFNKDILACSLREFLASLHWFQSPSRIGARSSTFKVSVTSRCWNKVSIPFASGRALQPVTLIDPDGNHEEAIEFQSPSHRGAPFGLEEHAGHCVREARPSFNPLRIGARPSTRIVAIESPRTSRCFNPLRIGARPSTGSVGYFVRGILGFNPLRIGARPSTCDFYSSPLIGLDPLTDRPRFQSPSHRGAPSTCRAHP